MSKQLSARDLGCLVLRLGLGLIFLAHGYQKFSLVTDEGRTWTWGNAWGPFMPEWMQATVAFVEVLGGLALLLGLFTRVAAVCLCLVQFGALYLVFDHRDFIRSEFGEKSAAFSYLKVGWEYNFSLIMQCAAVILLGAGMVSVDYLLGRRRRAAQEKAAVAGINPPHFDTAPAPAESAPSPHIKS
jgi:putative oxidoreductase